MLLMENLPCRASEPGEDEVAPKVSHQTAPAGLPGTSEANYPAKASPLHLTTTQVANRYGVKPPSD